MISTNDKIKAFAATVQEIEKANIISLCGSLLGNEASYIVRIVPGRKYVKVDVHTSGKYMIEIETETIFGIKAYGKINRGHNYGSLDAWIEKNSDKLAPEPCFEKQIEEADGVRYLLWHNDKGPFISLTDIDSGEQVTLINYPTEENAQKAFWFAVVAARKCERNKKESVCIC